MVVPSMSETPSSSGWKGEIDPSWFCIFKFQKRYFFSELQFFWYKKITSLQMSDNVNPIQSLGWRVKY